MDVGGFGRRSADGASRRSILPAHLGDLSGEISFFQALDECINLTSTIVSRIMGICYWDH